MEKFFVKGQCQILLSLHCHFVLVLYKARISSIFQISLVFITLAFVKHALRLFFWFYLP